MAADPIYDSSLESGYYTNIFNNKYPDGSCCIICNGAHNKELLFTGLCECTDVFVHLSCANITYKADSTCKYCGLNYNLSEPVYEMENGNIMHYPCLNVYPRYSLREKKYKLCLHYYLNDIIRLDIIYLQPKALAKHLAELEDPNIFANGIFTDCKVDLNKKNIYDCNMRELFSLYISYDGVTPLYMKNVKTADYRYNIKGVEKIRNIIKNFKKTYYK